MDHRASRRQVILLASVLLAIVTTCRREEASAPPPAPNPLQVENVQLRQQLKEAEDDAAAQRAYIEHVTRTIEEVQDHLLSIAPVATTVRIASAESSAEGMAPSRRKEMVASLERVEARLRADSEELTRLQEETASVRARSADLDRTVTRLRDTVQQKNKEIASLKSAMSKMTAQVVTLQRTHEDDTKVIDAIRAEMEARTAELARQVDDANRTYVVVGKVKSLVDRGFLREHRRLLRKTTYDVAPGCKLDMFDVVAGARDTEIDISALPDQIHLYPPRPQTYRLVRTSATSSRLIIEEPRAFWSTRFVIVAID